ncbi:hypothetical protein N431DRAFT_394587 [Stipitochalara longipes BDJ]|nr:hypothetical protein N431DRAFT_394587 [Stipitochalara longipes BDJ]
MTFQAMFLPDEILLMIFTRLPLEDIKCLRLVCHCFRSCSSQFLLWFLDISSTSRSLRFYRRISSDDLFRRGISKIVYNTRLNHTITAEHDHVLPEVQLAPDAFDQCYSVYDLLCYGIPRLPMLREIVITDRTQQTSPNLSITDLFTNALEINQARTTDDQLSLFILVRALSAVHSRPQTFRISLQNCIPGAASIQSTKSRHENDSYGTGYGIYKSPTLFDRCLTTALEIFQDLQHLSIITQSPSQQTPVEPGFSAFTTNLCALVSTAGPNLRILEVAIHEPVPAQARDGSLLLSTALFAITPRLFPTLSQVMLKGLSMDGSALIAFLSRQSSLEKLRLVEIRLIPTSSNWTAIVDDLCLLLGVQFEAGKINVGRKRGDRPSQRGKRIMGEMPMERIRMELEGVFEPSDGGMERALSIGSTQMRGYFLGMEDNPLRSCYENFVT